MGEKIYIADKKTLDEVNKKLDDFTGGIDWKQYKSVEKYMLISNKPKTSTVFEITGKGYIRDLIITVNDYYSSSDLKIIIDGQIYMSNKITKGQSGRYCYGIAYIGDNKVGNTGKIEYEHNNINEYLAQPIFFNSNVKLVLDKPFESFDLYFLGGVTA